MGVTCAFACKSAFSILTRSFTYRSPRAVTLPCALYSNFWAKETVRFPLNVAEPEGSIGRRNSCTISRRGDDARTASVPRGARRSSSVPVTSAFMPWEVQCRRSTRTRFCSSTKSVFTVESTGSYPGA